MMDYRELDFTDWKAIQSMDVVDIAKLLRDCRNELCYQCEEYKYSHVENSICSRCRWRER